MERPDVIPVRSSEVMRRCKLDITQWRNADDVQREAWRNQAREEIAKESEDTGPTVPDRVLELEAKCDSLESDIAAVNRTLINLTNRIDNLPTGGNTP